MIKRLILALMAAVLPLALGLLFTYDVIKLEWISMMEIQESFSPQEAPLPMPARSVPVQGAAYIPGLGAPVNPVPVDEVSLLRGEQLFGTHCAHCHGEKGEGNGPFAAFLKNKPANLVTGNARTSSDGALFIVITNGVAGKMPGLISNLPGARERWDVVNYIRKLEQSGKK